MGKGLVMKTKAPMNRNRPIERQPHPLAAGGSACTLQVASEFARYVNVGSSKYPICGGPQSTNGFPNRMRPEPMELPSDGALADWEGEGGRVGTGPLDFRGG